VDKIIKLNIGKLFGLLLLITSSAVVAQDYTSVLSTSNKMPNINQRSVEISNNHTEKVANRQLVDNKITIRDEAFKQLLNQTVPLTPEQIIELRKKVDDSQAAVATTPRTPPQPVSSTLVVDLSPGAASPLIRLAIGFVTSIVFVDVTGQPWPIGDYSLGNPKDFNIQWDQKTNTLFIQSTIAYVTGNLAVRLANLDTPIMLSLVTGQKHVDYRADLQVLARGPNAIAAISGDTLPPAANTELLSILDGVPPVGSIELKVSGGEGRAWLTNNKLIFRSKMKILSPAWSAIVSSIDGTNVYELRPTPIILALQNGKSIKLELTGL
jgi:intracellular multiplication protein IcmK